MRCKQPFSDNLSASKSFTNIEAIVFADNDASSLATLSHTVVIIDNKGDTKFSVLWIRIECIPLYDNKQIISTGKGSGAHI